MTVRLVYEEGTVRITGGDALDDLPFVERDARSKSRRAPAHRYVDLLGALDERGVAYEDRVFALSDLSLDSTYQLREYQRAALDDWTAADRRGVLASHASEGSRPLACRGVLELPTGSGKTVVGIAAMEALDTPTLVVVPTIDLLEQWRRELEREFDREVGQLGGGEQRLADVTVSTYDSAYLRADELGDRFGLVVFDEVHHLGGEGYRDIARLLAAPARMGLTATFERPDGAHEVVEELVGPLVHRIAVDELAGDHLADYDIKRLTVELTPEEREVYERHQETFTDYLASSGIQMRSGSDYQELVKRSGSDPRAREALLAKQRAREVMMNADEKVERLESLLDRHRGGGEAASGPKRRRSRRSDDRVIVFTAHTDLVYRLSERFLIPAITHETSADERREILERFRSGEYSRVVTANVLDEGVDVPDANVAVVLSGSGSEREFTQRLGRILRPKADGERALLYEIVTEETAEERVARRRR
ncbi:type III restriction protein res subunit [Halosimplex carlsbadense 2-9-1]|uniref:DNA 3'-5' helicase n=1 Tax=Halosimplex carlsbadense 2-9-1 TaxID=797114 RepID=M0CRQ3_9EURY|nr:DEAD/DEAH box helicase family protein [Halosimplex carlsbadense]ELZ25062.1 type III restriction protein res subunit [Halosimplex carlsbadense 2-9-1]